MDFIKNSDLPACKNCVHFIPDNIGYSFSMCKKFGKKDLVSDKIVHSFADICRMNETECGNEGKHFIKEKIHIRNMKRVNFKFIPVGIVLGILVLYS